MKKIALFLLFTLACAYASAQVLTVTPAKVPAYFTSEFFGVHAHNPEIAGHYPATPFGAWRMWDGAGTWADVQPTGAASWSWAKSDAYLANIERTPGTKVLLTFGRTPTWASADKIASAYGAGFGSPPANMADFRAYVHALATRYKGRIEAYQTGNEANSKDFWTGTIPQLVDLTCAAYQEIKAVDPTIKVVSPSGTGAYSPPTDFVKAFLDAGGAACVDVVSYHLYTSGSPPENFVIPLLGVRDSLIAAGYGRFPLWDTETGYLVPGTKLNAIAAWSDYEKASRVSGYDAADFFIRAMTLARAIGFERFYTYAWDNAKLGLSDPVSGLPRESAAAITRFYNIFTNGGLVGTCARTTTGIWTCGVKVGTTSKNGQLVWVDPSASAQIQSYAVPYSSIVTDFHTDAAPRVTRFTEVTISASPKLLVWD